MTDQIKLCTECKHMKRINFYRYCNFTRSPVDGSPGWLCVTARACGGPCGPRGENWAPIPAFKWVWQK